MTLNKLKLTAACVVAALVLAGAGTVAAWKPEPRKNAPTPKAKPAEDDRTRLQGKWKAVKMVTDGEDVPADEVKKMVWEIDGDKIRFVDKPGNEQIKVSFTLDPEQSPKRIDLTTDVDPKVPANLRPPEDKVLPGVYELKGNTLTLCLGKKGRPTEFKSDKAGKTTLMTFEKDEPKKDDKPKAKGEKPADEELKKFEGKWRVVRLAGPRGEAPEAEMKGMSWQLTGSKLIARNTPEEKGEEGKIALDAKKEPKQIDLTMQVANGTGVAPGIYEFKDGKLRIALGDPGGERPTTFEVNRKSGGLIELEKVEEK